MMTDIASTSRKRPKTSNSSSSASTIRGSDGRSPSPVTARAPPEEPPIVTHGFEISDAPRQSNFISATALERYRASATFRFTTERAWQLEDFGAEPIVIHCVPVEDWIDWHQAIVLSGFETLARFHAVFVPTLIREFYANVSDSSMAVGEEHITSHVRGRRIVITPA